jgi:hypothetical protein
MWRKSEYGESGGRAYAQSEFRNRRVACQFSWVRCAYVSGRNRKIVAYTDERIPGRWQRGPRVSAIKLSATNWRGRMLLVKRVQREDNDVNSLSVLFWSRLLDGSRAWCRSRTLGTRFVDSRTILGVIRYVRRTQMPSRGQRNFALVWKWWVISFSEVYVLSN